MIDLPSINLEKISRFLKRNAMQGICYILDFQRQAFGLAVPSPAKLKLVPYEDLQLVNYCKLIDTTFPSQSFFEFPSS